MIWISSSNRSSRSTAARITESSAGDDYAGHMLLPSSFIKPPHSIKPVKIWLLTAAHAEPAAAAHTVDAAHAEHVDVTHSQSVGAAGVAVPELSAVMLLLQLKQGRIQPGDEAAPSSEILCAVARRALHLQSTGPAALPLSRVSISSC